MKFSNASLFFVYFVLLHMTTAIVSLIASEVGDKISNPAYHKEIGYSTASLRGKKRANAAEEADVVFLAGGGGGKMETPATADIPWDAFLLRNMETSYEIYRELLTGMTGRTSFIGRNVPHTADHLPPRPCQDLVDSYLAYYFLPISEQLYMLQRDTDTFRLHVRHIPKSALSDAMHKWEIVHSLLNQGATILDEIQNLYRKSKLSGGDLSTLSQEADQIAGSLQPASKEMFDQLDKQLVFIDEEPPVAADNACMLLAFIDSIEENAFLQSLQHAAVLTNKLHKNLHSLYNTLRYLFVRHERSVTQMSRRNLEANNVFLLDLQGVSKYVRGDCSLNDSIDNILLLQGKKAQSNLGLVVPIELGTPELMAPVVSFSALQSRIKEEGRKDRFSKRLEEIRRKLRQLHNNASILLV